MGQVALIQALQGIAQTAPLTGLITDIQVEVEKTVAGIGGIEIIGHQKQNIGLLCRKDGCGKGKDSDYKTSEYWFHIIFLNERVGRRHLHRPGS